MPITYLFFVSPLAACLLLTKPLQVSLIERTSALFTSTVFFLVAHCAGIIFCVARDDGFQ